MQEGSAFSYFTEMRKDRFGKLYGLGNSKLNREEKTLCCHKKRAANLGRPEIPQIFVGRFFERGTAPGQLAVKARLG
jgi:hypothetical protein